MTHTAAADITHTADYRIYVASLADYNDGILHGAWIDCDGLGADDIGELPKDGLAARYFDYEAFKDDLFISDNWSERGADGVHVFRHI